MSILISVVDSLRRSVSSQRRKRNLATPTSILAHPTVLDRVFFPRSTERLPTRYVTVEGAQLACYEVSPYEDAGTVLHFHGNGELASDYLDELASGFLAAKVNVCFVDYRGYGLSTGTPSLVEQLDDGEQIVHSLGLRPEKQVVYGRSLGSLYAVELARRIPQVAGLVLESAIADVVEDFDLESVAADIGLSPVDLHREVDVHFNTGDKLRSFEGPVLILHAENDTNVDKSHAERLHRWSVSVNKRLVMFPRGDHTTILHTNWEEYCSELSSFMESLGLDEK